MRSLLWSQRGPAAPRLVLVTAAGVLAYLVTAALTFGARPEQYLVSLAVIALAAWSDASRRVFYALLPFYLLGVVYDLTHITEPLVRYLTVHIHEPYAFDRSVFGIRTAGGVLTPNEFFARHHWPWLDVVTGLGYILYVYVAVGFALYLLIARRRDPQAQHLLRRFGWTFLAVNLAGFATYYLYPAAPPWYTAEHGFGPPDFTVAASPAAALRFDELTGTHYFASFYGRAADVFGAIPSLHVTYPLIVWLYARELRSWWLTLLGAGFFVVVTFGAVYLQHHYVLDVLLGAAYAVAAYLIDRALQRRARRIPSAGGREVSST